MKYRVTFKDGKYFPTYFRLKKDAIAYQQCMGGTIQRKIGLEWFDC